MLLSLLSSLSDKEEVPDSRCCLLRHQGKFTARLVIFFMVSIVKESRVEVKR